MVEERVGGSHPQIKLLRSVRVWVRFKSLHESDESLGRSPLLEVATRFQDVSSLCRSNAAPPWPIPGRISNFV